MIKTINLNGSEIKVTELGGDNTEIINNSSGIVYASKLPNISAGGDEVIAIPAGAIDGLYGTRGTVYLLGSGNVELRGTDHKITETRGQSAGGGLGIVQGYIDSGDAAALAEAREYAASITSELAGYIGYTDNDIYGLEADFENMRFTRLAGANGKNAGADFDSVRAFGGRRRCNLSDSGEVLAYYGDKNFKADGSNGQVMVEQPKFYYRVVPLKTEKIGGADGYHLRKARYYISDTPKAGFKIHPAFVHSGTETDKIYLSAFEGCVYDTSAKTYLLNDEQTADYNNDKLSSISGAKPCSGETQQLTKDNARKLAHNRGIGWEQALIRTISATQLLFIVEYAGFNSQTALGTGASFGSEGTENLAAKTGTTIVSGNSSGTVNNPDNVEMITYRGEENFWGNIFTWADGIYAENPAPWEEKMHGAVYVSDSTPSGDPDKAVYENTGIKACYGIGYISAFGYSEIYDWLFIPSEKRGNSTLPVGDYIWNGKAGRQSFIHGGRSTNPALFGAFSWNLHREASNHYQALGARLVYIPR